MWHLFIRHVYLDLLQRRGSQLPQRKEFRVLRCDPSDVDDVGRPGRRLRLDTSHSIGSQRTFAIPPAPQRGEPTSSFDHPVLLLRLARRLARVTIDDHRRPTAGLLGDDVLMVRTIQVLRAQLRFGTAFVETQHGTSGRVVKPASYPGLPLVDRNEQPLSSHPWAGISRGLLLTSGAPWNPSPYAGRSRVRGIATDSPRSLFATLPEG